MKKPLLIILSVAAALLLMLLSGCADKNGAQKMTEKKISPPEKLSYISSISWENDSLYLCGVKKHGERNISVLCFRTKDDGKSWESVWKEKYTAPPGMARLEATADFHAGQIWVSWSYLRQENLSGAFTDESALYDLKKGIIGRASGDKARTILQAGLSGSSRIFTATPEYQFRSCDYRTGKVKDISLKNCSGVADIAQSGNILYLKGLNGGAACCDAGTGKQVSVGKIAGALFQYMDKQKAVGNEREYAVYSSDSEEIAGFYLDRNGIMRFTEVGSQRLADKEDVSFGNKDITFVDSAAKDSSTIYASVYSSSGDSCSLYRYTLKEK